MADIPPRYVAAPTWLVYADLPAAVFRTAVRIWGLGWRYRYERTAPISEDALCEVCGVGRSQLYGHLRRLISTRVLRYTKTAGAFVFHFDRPDAAQIPQSACPENRTNSTLSVVVDLPDPETQSPDQQQQQHCSLHGGECEGGSHLSGKSDRPARLAALDRIGVLEPVRSEIAALDHATAAYLAAWADWFQQQDRLQPGGVILQIRAGVEPPERKPDPCDPLRYFEGKYAALIEH